MYALTRAEQEDGVPRSSTLNLRQHSFCEFRTVNALPGIIPLTNGKDSICLQTYRLAISFQQQEHCFVWNSVYYPTVIIGDRNRIMFVFQNVRS